jgi:hypothetical protein
VSRRFKPPELCRAELRKRTLRGVPIETGATTAIDPGDRLVLVGVIEPLRPCRR